jgi:hypothetical protein
MTAYYEPWPSMDFLTTGFLQGGSVDPKSHPQPGGPGLHICDPKRQGDPAIPPGIGYTF